MYSLNNLQYNQLSVLTSYNRAVAKVAAATIVDPAMAAAYPIDPTLSLSRKTKNSSDITTLLYLLRMPKGSNSGLLSRENSQIPFDSAVLKAMRLQ